ncbi:MAG: type I secretion system permease/ATPase [Deltaproteobacteria bacterium]|nr:type I secretion system permease/ATPase [Deltaproteobacteria bacterium]
MQEILKSWFKCFIFICFFGICINLIYLVVPIYMMVVYDRVLFSFSHATLFTLSVGLLISLFAMGLLEYFRSKMLMQAGIDLEQKMYPFVLSSMHKNAISLNRQNYTRGLEDLKLVKDAIINYRILWLLDLPWIFIYLALLYFMHPMLGFVGISGVFMVSIFQSLLRLIGKKRYTTADVIFNKGSNFINTTLQNAELISEMGMLKGVLNKHEEFHQKVLLMQSEADSFKAGTGAVIRMLHIIFAVAVFGTGAYLFFDGKITVGIMFASVIIITRIFYPFQQSLASMKFSIEAIAAYKRLSHFVDTRKQKKSLSLPEPEGKLEAENITLAINSRTILHNISFVLEPGETLGIIGPSAAGKTSLCKVLLGIWPASAGKVRLDGAEISQWSNDDLGEYIGYLPQEITLFSGKIDENIARLQVVTSDKVIKASKMAGAYNMILKLPQGYDTRIDNTGKNLSAGQRQLISLARVLYNDPKVVLMDEPQNTLDDVGVKALLEALNILKKEKITTILVTDRPNLLVNTDKILMIKEGQVAMYGPTRDVLNQLNQQQPAQQPATRPALRQV